MRKLGGWAQNLKKQQGAQFCERKQMWNANAP